MADTDIDPAPAAAAPPALPAPSAFLHLPKTVTHSATPSIIHLKRDLLLPVTFAAAATATDGPPAARDPRNASSTAGILNTRFGDFPHASILGQPYGAQVRATNLGHSNRKRKRRIDPAATAPAVDEDHNASGFLHILAPTAELWTASLPHRTQVVYTPDSAFVLHKLGVRPGSVIIEAGAGSGSFTHAAVRAAYAGYPDAREGPAAPGDVLEEAKRREREGPKALRKGRVWSYEFHRERVGKLREEIGAHGLSGLVEVVHRDVCKDGFLVRKRAGEAEEDEEEEEEEEGEGEFESPGATAVFLDLPAPWLALPHLTRGTRPTPSLPTSTGLTPTPSPAPACAGTPQPATPDAPAANTADTLSALSPTEAVRICTFSPCIEQVTRTVSVLRKLGWVEIEMHELQHRRLEVRRNNRRGYEDGAGPRSVAEAVQRLKWVGEYRSTKKEKDALQAAWRGDGDGDGPKRDGPIVTRVEPEIKTHTSYLVFAVLPREWTPQQEEDVAAYVAATTRGTVNAPVVGEGEKWKWTGETVQRVSKRQLKKLERDARKAGKGDEGEEGEAEGEEELKSEEASEGGDKMEVDG